MEDSMFDIMPSNQIDTTIAKVINRDPELHELILTNGNLSDAQLSRALFGLMINPLIQHFTLCQSVMSDHMVDQLVNVLIDVKTLTSLVLGYIPFTAGQLARLFGVKHNWHRVSLMYIDVIDPLCQLITGDTELEELALGGCRLSNQTIIALAQAITDRGSGSQSLFIGFNSPVPISLNAVSALAECSRHLKSLSLNQMQLDDQAATILASGLAGNTCLEQLSLPENLIESNGAICLAAAANSLRGLDLESNLIDQDGCQALIQILTTNLNIMTVNLYGNARGNDTESINQYRDQVNRAQLIILNGLNNPDSPISLLPCDGSVTRTIIELSKVEHCQILWELCFLEAPILLDDIETQ
jgi:hypothetical protein